MARNKKKNKKISQVFIMTFFVMLLVLSYKVLAERNRVVRLELNTTSYVELLKYNDSSMTTITDRVVLRNILIMINELGAKEVDITGNPVSEEFVNVYDKNYKKVTIIKSGKHLKVGNKWYLLDDRSAAKFDKVFNEYN